MLRPRHLGLVAALAAVPFSAACIPSNIVARQDRSVAFVVPDLDAVEWEAVDSAGIAGFYESVKLEGDGAANVLSVSYYFSSDGSYSGAALVDDADGIAFQTLSGKWSLAKGQLDLGDGNLLRVLRSGDLLSMSSPGGTAVLRRRVLD